MFKFFKDEAGYLLAITLIGLSMFLYGMTYYKVTHAQSPFKSIRKKQGVLVDLPQVVPASRSPSKVNSKVTQKVPPVRVGIIDTGYDASILPQGYEPLKICPEGSYDFITNKPGVSSAHWHGTVTGTLIAEALKGIDYCAVIYQVANDMGGIPDEALIAAAKRARSASLVAVNMSLGGPEFSQDLRMALIDLTKSGTTEFIAAGNENKDLTDTCNTYPACYGIPYSYTVGATDDGFLRASYSNYGVAVNAWYPGTVEFGGEVVKGTSFAAPRALGDFVASLVRKVAEGQ